MTTESKGTMSVRAFRAAARKAEKERYELCLYIAGTTPHSTAAVASIVSICDQRIPGGYDLVIVDVYQEPLRAKADQVIAVPTLLKKRPLPVRRLVGDLSNRALVLAGLNLASNRRGRHEKKDP